jgi:hypothetical protein
MSRFGRTYQRKREIPNSLPQGIGINGLVEKESDKEAIENNQQERNSPSLTKTYDRNHTERF